MTFIILAFLLVILGVLLIRAILFLYDRRLERPRVIVGVDIRSRLSAAVDGVGRPQRGLVSAISGWFPLRYRFIGSTAAGALHEGVPGHLRAPLLHWLERRISGHQGDPATRSHLAGRQVHRSGRQDDALALRVANKARIALPGSIREAGVSRPLGPKEALAVLAEAGSGSFLLDLIDKVLACGPHQDGSAGELDELLSEGGSAFRVRDDGMGLERRVDPAVTAAVQNALNNSAASGRHLTLAWQAAYGMKPDPSKAYAEAVKAIEASLIPLVTPDETRATLGTALRKLRTTDSNWELAVLDHDGNPARIGPVTELARLIWEGHRDRHAGTPTATAVTPEAAEFATHAAAMILHCVDHRGLRPAGSGQATSPRPAPAIRRSRS